MFVIPLMNWNCGSSATLSAAVFGSRPGRPNSSRAKSHTHSTVSAPSSAASRRAPNSRSKIVPPSKALYPTAARP